MSRFNALRSWSIVLLASTLVGCAGLGRAPDAPVVTDLATVDDWQARGRIAVSGAGGGGSGSFRWEQDNARSDILIRGPIGIGSLRVQMNSRHPERLNLQLGDGRELESQAALAELQARLGAAVPTDKLRYWLLGLAAPGAHQWLERNGESAVLEQDGWRIEFLEYSSTRGAPTPSRLKATSGDARIRLVIKDWQLGRAR